MLTCYCCPHLLLLFAPGAARTRRSPLLQLASCVEAWQGDAHATGLEAGSVDLITVGQAIHWCVVAVGARIKRDGTMWDRRYTGVLWQWCMGGDCCGGGCVPLG